MIKRDIKTIHKSPHGNYEVVYLKPLREYRIWDTIKKQDTGAIYHNQTEAIETCDKLEIFREIITKET